LGGTEVKRAHLSVAKDFSPSCLMPQMIAEACVRARGLPVRIGIGSPLESSFSRVHCEVLSDWGLDRVRWADFSWIMSS
jgi:hypothetical protein